MAQKTKKAKLAHEKQRGGQETDLGRAFLANKVIELVEHQGKSGAVVELDEAGTLGIIDSMFVMAAADGALTLRRFACPATYDPIAQQKAVERYQAYSQN